MGILSFLQRWYAATKPELNPGQQAEALAAAYLQQQGLHIVARNYRCQLGELDLICRDGNCVVFVEVRLRHSNSHGGAAASIGHAKQQRLRRAARHWLSRQAPCPCRFDCVLLDRLAPDAITWIRHAFEDR